MSNTASLKPVKIKWASKSEWKVEIPESLSPTGRRRRYFFNTKAAAELFARQQKSGLRLYGVQGGDLLPPSLQEQAVRAVEAIKPFGVPLARVVADWIERQQEEKKSLRFEEAMNLFIESRPRSPSYLASLRQTRNRMKMLHDRLMCDITPDDVSAALDGMTDAVQNFTVRILGGAFMFAQKRGYCAQNPAKAVGIMPVCQPEIEVYCPEEALLIMRTAETRDPALLPFLVVSFFLGIRRSEMLRLDWSSFQLEERFCRLPAHITKKQRSRHIQITDNSLEWLIRITPREGKVVPFTDNILRKRLEALQVLHGVKTIKHGYRHSFATYSLAAHGDINRLTLELGHNNPNITFKHYAKVTVKKEAEKFFAIYPQSIVCFADTEETCLVSDSGVLIPPLCATQATLYGHPSAYASGQKE